MRLSTILSSLLATSVVAHPTSQLSTRADPDLVGYLGVFFLGAEPSVYFYLSNGNDALSFKALNAKVPILDPTLGTGGVRDPSLIKGAGDDLGKKWYIIGTDLDIAYTDWDQASRHGSRSIFIWESTDLINWGTERLVELDGPAAGMVWAPDAIYDEARGEYLVHWSSKMYPDSDPYHNTTNSLTVLRHAYTKDFITFSEPSTLIDYSPTSLIDLAILPLGGDQYIRFLKNESGNTVFQERSTTGLYGPWSWTGGNNGIVTTQVEGPYAWLDNVTPNKATLLLDYFGSDEYRPFTCDDLNAAQWTQADMTNFPHNLRHGSVVGINQADYDRLNAKWG